MNYYKRFIGDYQSDTAHLSIIEHGAYTLLLDYIYGTEKPLPKTKDAIYRICRAFDKDEQKSVDSVLEQFFHEEDDGWVNSKALAVMAVDMVRIEAARVNGLRGGRPRNKTQKKPSGFQNDNPDVTQSESYPQPQPQLQPTPKPEPTPKQKEKPKSKPQSNTLARGDKSPPAKTAAVWEAYSSAYETRYGVPPIRNARVNGQLANMVKRLGEEHAAQVASFYLTHNNSYYVREKHSVNALLNGCEGLSTELRSGKQVTNTQAQQVDKTQTNLNAFLPLINEARR